MTIVCLNFYGPYVDREIFWFNLFKVEGMMSSKLILGGDLNYSVGLYEIWGDKARVDNLSDFFIRQMEMLHLWILPQLFYFLPGIIVELGVRIYARDWIGSFFLLIFLTVICISDNGLDVVGIRTIIPCLCKS